MADLDRQCMNRRTLMRTELKKIYEG